MELERSLLRHEKLVRRRALDALSCASIRRGCIRRVRGIFGVGKGYSECRWDIQRVIRAKLSVRNTDGTRKRKKAGREARRMTDSK